MTRYDDHGPEPETATERAVRQMLSRRAEQLPPVPDLVGAMHHRAHGLRRLRRARAGLAAAVAVVALVVVVPRMISGDEPHTGVVAARTGTPAPTSASPAGTGTASPSPRASASGRSVTAAGSPTGSRAPGTSTSGGPAATATTPGEVTGTSAGMSGPWGALGFDDEFGAPAVDPDRWTSYTGASGSPETLWSPQEVGVGDGALRLGVERVSDTTPVARAGGVKRAGDGERYGRWEIRWRMTAGYGVTGQFLFLGEGPDGIGEIATLSPADRRLILEDLAHGTRQVVSVDGTQYHVLTLEIAPHRVTWSLDGRTVAAWTAAPDRPVVAALQALIQGADCGRTPLPAACAERATFPQYLDIDYVRYWPYVP